MASSLTVTLGEIRRLYACGQFEAAAELGWALLRADPFDTGVLNLLALAEQNRGNAAAGVVLLQRAVKAEPLNYILWNDLGNLYFTTGATAAAEEAYRQALACNPGCAEACNNLAVIALKRCEYAAARNLLEQALILRPQYAEALYNLGNALAGLGKFQKAQRRYEQALALDPQHPGTHFNLGITRLVLGDLAGGWPDWEWRWRSTLAPFKRVFPERAWKGEPIENRRLLLYAEQGIGDTLQFLRYLPLVAARTGAIVLEVQRPLVPLISGHPLVLATVARGDALPHFDVQCSLMSLGSIFATTLATIPPAQLSFASLPMAAQRAAGPLRVGLVWAGNPAHVRDHDRSLPLAKLAPLFKVTGVRWFSLQKGAAAERLHTEGHAGTHPGKIEDLAAGFADFADTARAVALLDLIITVDTSVAHLGGAMGKPVWILLPAVPDWRWLLKRRDSPWYPTARLFRQGEPGDWPGVVESVRQELEILAGHFAM